MHSVAAAAALLLVGCNQHGTDPRVDAAPDEDDGKADQGRDAAPDPVAEPDTVVVAEGTVRGVARDGALSFKGIPYAAPPTGPLRFAPPAPPIPWDGVRDGSAYGAVCLQPDSPSYATHLVGSEDCLTLNVWTPEPRPQEPLPVLFYVHGGAYVVGSSADQREGEYAFDGTRLAVDGPAVVVTINYRLGPLGFLAHPALSAETPYGGSGDWGFMDQIAALRWVQENIGAFGGDPDRVMVFGVSAGGGSASVLLASPEAHGLFSSVLLESSSGYTTPLATAEEQGEVLGAALGCEGADAAACLRAAASEDVLSALDLSLQVGETQIAFGPSVDGLVLPEPLLASFRAGRHNHVPVVVGTTAEEFSWVILYFYPDVVTTPAEYEARVFSTFGQAAAPVLLTVYPAASYPTPQDALVAIFTDYVYTCPGRLIARALAGSQDEPVWRYLYTHEFHDGPLAAYGAGHGYDDMMVFHNWPATLFPLDEEERAMADALARYWTRLAADGDPNGDDDPAWSPYDPIADDHFAIDTPFGHGARFRDAECALWDPYVE